MMATIGTMAVNIVARTDKFIAGLNGAHTALGRFGQRMATLTNLAAGLGVGGGLAVMLRSFETAGSELHDMSVRTGVTVENLSALKFAAEQSGTSFNALTRAFQFMQKSGVDPNTFGQIAQQLAAIPDPTLRAQTALKLFGKTGAQLLPMIAELPQLTAEFEKLGGGLTTNMASQADALGDAWGKLRLAMGNVAQHIAAALAPAITQLSEWIAANGRHITTWIDEHKSLVTILGTTAAGLTVAIPLLWTFNTVMATIATTLKALRAIATSGLLIKLLTLLASSAAAPYVLAGATAAGVGYAGYKIYQGAGGGQHGSSRSWDADVAGNTGRQVQEQQETNELLKRSLGRTPITLHGAGVR